VADGFGTPCTTRALPIIAEHRRARSAWFGVTAILLIVGQTLLMDCAIICCAPLSPGSAVRFGRPPLTTENGGSVWAWAGARTVTDMMNPGTTAQICRQIRDVNAIPPMVTPFRRRCSGATPSSFAPTSYVIPPTAALISSTQRKLFLVKGNANLVALHLFKRNR